METRVSLKYFVNGCRYDQSTQNSTFMISLQYFKKEGRDEVDFLHTETLNFATS